MLSYRLIRTADLIPYARNARTHSEAQVAKIASSIREFGFINPVITDGQNGIVAGHGRVMAASKLGLKEIPCLEAAHLTEAQKRAYVLADNRMALDAGWDAEMLKVELGELQGLNFDLALTGFSLDEIGTYLADKTEGLTDPDAVPEAPERAVTVLGDTWILGKHRVMCGDSTSIDAVEKLMAGGKADMVFTDPPDGVSAVGGRTQTVAKKGIRKIENDELRKDELKQFIVAALSLLPLKPGGSFYVCYDHKTQHEFTGAIRELGWHQRNTIIWNKNQFGLGPKGYRPKYELIAFGSPSDTYQWHGDNAQADVWDIPRPTERPGNHPTPKPVALVERAIINSSKAGDIILDSFGGSGTTLLAAEKNGRHSRLMELDPKYCDVIVKRWQDFTGQKAILESTGRTFEDMASDRYSPAADGADSYTAAIAAKRKALEKT